MLDALALNVIRRRTLPEQISMREISRRAGMARKTVKKYLRSDETEPTYAKRASPSKLDRMPNNSLPGRERRQQNRGNSGAICSRTTQ